MKFKEFLNESVNTDNIKKILKKIITYLKKHKKLFKDGEESLKKAEKLIKNNKFSKEEIKWINDIHYNIID